VSKVQFFSRNQKECIKSYNWFQTFCSTKMCPLLWKYMFIEWTWRKNKSNKHFKVLKLWRKGCKAKNSFFRPFNKKIMFNGFKMSSFRCRSQVQKIILPKNMFYCPLKLILRFFEIFYIFDIKPKYLYTIIYEYEKSPLTHELSYIGLFNFFHLSLFHVNIICKK
jgi:hypothetical protein